MSKSKNSRIENFVFEIELFFNGASGMHDLMPEIRAISNSNNFCAFAIFVKLIHVDRDTRVVHCRLVHSYYVFIFCDFAVHIRKRYSPVKIKLHSDRRFQKFTGCMGVYPVTSGRKA